MAAECANHTVACPLGTSRANAHVGWSPPGALMMIRMREPRR